MIRFQAIALDYDGTPASHDHVLLHHASRGDFSRWIADVFLDRQLASQIRKAERRSGREGVALLRASLTGLVAGLIEP